MGSQKQLTDKNSPEDIRYREVADENASPKFRQIRWRSSRTLLIAGIAAALVVMTWLGWSTGLRPMLDERMVNTALQKVLDSSTADQVKSANVILNVRGEERDLFIVELLIEDTSAVSKEAIEAALRIAMNSGSIEARIARGRALRDGALGPKDTAEAVKEFAMAWQETESGVSAGAADALWIRAVLIAEGLAVVQNKEAAHEMAVRSAEKLNGWRLKQASTSASYGIEPFARKEPRLADSLFERRLRAGDKDAALGGFLNCSDLAPSPSAYELDIRSKDYKLLRKAADDCREKWTRLPAEHGVISAMGEWGELLLNMGRIEEGLKWMEAGRAELSHYAMLLEASAIMARANVYGNENELQKFGEAFDLYLAANKNEQGSLDQISRAFLYVDPLGTFLANGRLNRDGLFNIGEAIHSVAYRYGDGDKVGRLIRIYANNDPIWNQVLIGFRSFRPKATVKSGPWSALDQLVPTKVNSPEQPGNIQPTTPKAATAAPKERAKPTRDREEQDHTGYLPNAPMQATGGHARFTVDNEKGGGDAVVRLYAGGLGPAVRSFFVKKGETFTADGLMPGEYVLRYRFMGSEDTYEADRTFELKQMRTEGGISFSNVKVTLFQVAHGNMKVKKVPSESF